MALMQRRLKAVTKEVQHGSPMAAKAVADLTYSTAQEPPGRIQQISKTVRAIEEVQAPVR